MKHRFTFLLIIVLVFSSALYWYSTHQVKKATVSFDRTTALELNHESTIPLQIDTAGYSINAAEVYAHFDPQHLQIKALLKEPSLFTLWIKDQPHYSNQSGDFSFAGGLPTPGFAGSGQIGAIVVYPIAKGLTQITFDQKSRILVNDGLGTAVPLRLPPLVIEVK